jgi:hypothetical protein
MRKAFGVPASRIEAMIERAFRLWSEYPERKKLIGPEKIYVAKKLALKRGCRGKEDLAFYFGIDRPEIRKTKARYRHPFAFVEMTAPDHPTQPLWGKGYVWVVEPYGFGRLNAPAWQTSEEALAGLLLHEVGHVFGNGHVEGTVMTARIGQYLEADTAFYRSGPSYLSRYDRIDSEREFITCLFCPETYAGDSKQMDLSSVFRELTGSAPSGEVKVRFQRTSSPPADAALLVEDGKTNRSFPVRILAKAAEFEDGASCFSGLYGRDFHHAGVSFTGTMKTAAGAEIPVALNYNVGGRKITLRRLDGLSASPLFISGSD